MILVGGLCRLAGYITECLKDDVLSAHSVQRR